MATADDEDGDMMGMQMEKKLMIKCDNYAVMSTPGPISSMQVHSPLQYHISFDPSHSHCGLGYHPVL